MTWDTDPEKPPYEKKKGYFPRWPDPFANQVQNIEVLACEGEWLAAITMANDGFGAWAFSNLLPQPSEITRKWILGGYRCGFFLTGRRKSPLDVVWRAQGKKGVIAMSAKGARKFLARLAFGPLSSTFFFWGAQTYWEALATWHTLTYAADKCDKDGNEAIATSAITPLAFEEGSGQVGIHDIIYDPHGLFNALSGSITVPPGQTWTYASYGEFLNLNGKLRDVEVWVNDSVSGQQFGNQTASLSATDGAAVFDLGPFAFQGPAQVSTRFTYTQPGHSGPLHSGIRISRAIASIFPTDPDT